MQQETVAVERIVAAFVRFEGKTSLQAKNGEVRNRRDGDIWRFPFPDVGVGDVRFQSIPENWFVRGCGRAQSWGVLLPHPALQATANLRVLLGPVGVSPRPSSRSYSSERFSPVSA
jgi:hypothetical protein